MDKRLSNRILKAFETKFLGSQKLIQSTSSMNNNTRNVKAFVYDSSNDEVTKVFDRQL